MEPKWLVRSASAKIQQNLVSLYICLTYKPNASANLKFIGTFSILSHWPISAYDNLEHLICDVNNPIYDDLEHILCDVNYPENVLFFHKTTTTTTTQSQLKVLGLC